MCKYLHAAAGKRAQAATPRALRVPSRRAAGAGGAEGGAAKLFPEKGYSAAAKGGTKSPPVLARYLLFFSAVRAVGADFLSKQRRGETQ